MVAEWAPAAFHSTLISVNIPLVFPHLWQQNSRVRITWNFSSASLLPWGVFKTSKLPGSFLGALFAESLLAFWTSVPLSSPPRRALCSFNYFAPQLGRSEHLAPEWRSAPQAPSVGSEAGGQPKTERLGEGPWGKRFFCSAALLWASLSSAETEADTATRRLLSLAESPLKYEVPSNISQRGSILHFPVICYSIMCLIFWSVSEAR